MSEAAEVKLSAQFERKLGTGDYGSKTASAFLTVTLDPDADASKVSEEFSNMFSQLKAAVYDELGIEVLIDESGVIREKYNPQAAVKEGPGVQAARRELGATGGFDTKGLEVMNIADLVEDIPDKVVAKCNELGITKVWANNGTYGPYYKEHLPKGETPKVPNPKNPAQAGIIK